MLYPKLTEQVLRPFDRAGDKLGIEHHIERVYSKVTLGLLISPVDLDGVAHCLKSMKRESDWQYQLQIFQPVVPIQEAGEPSQV